MTKTRLFLLIVWAADGSVVRRREYRTYDEAGLSDAAPTLEELIAGHSGEVRDRSGRPTAWGWEPVNPKVRPLVEAMLAAGIVTTGSGDMYGNDLVYVDLADGWEETVAVAEMPPGWTVTPMRANMARKALGLPPQPVNTPGRVYVRGRPTEGARRRERAAGPAVRLSRKGGTVTPQEAMAIVNSLQQCSSGCASGD